MTYLYNGEQELNYFTPVYSVIEGSSFTYTYDPNSSLVDLNGDGKLDLLRVETINALTPQSDRRQLRCFIGDGEGHFTLQAVDGLPADIGPLEQTGRWFAVAGDFNGDHNVDVMIIRPYRGVTLDLYWGNGAGSYVAGPRLDASGLCHANFYNVVDVDADGIDDLVASSGPGSGFSVLLLKGEQPPQPGSCVGAAYEYQFLPQIAFADIDADGLIDVVTANYSGSAEIYRNQDGGNFALWKSLGLELTDESGAVYYTGFGKLASLYVVDSDADGNFEIGSPTVLIEVSHDGELSDMSSVLPNWLNKTANGSVWAKDVNADGHIDLITSTEVYLWTELPLQ
jgi:hypothetical protein